MTLHRLLCRFGIHEWGRWSSFMNIERDAVRACWCCGKNQRKQLPDSGCDSPGGVLLGLCKCPACMAAKADVPNQGNGSR